MEEHEKRVLHFWKNIIMFFVFFPKRLAHILSKLILIFFPFLFFFFSFFFTYFLGIQTQKILIHKPKKFSHTQKKTFKPQHYLIKPVPLTSKSQTLLSLPKLSQLFQGHCWGRTEAKLIPQYIVYTKQNKTKNIKLLNYWFCESESVRWRSEWCFKLSISNLT